MNSPARDAEGYLLDPTEWTAEIAAQIAAALGIELTESHWRVIQFMREYYEEHQVAADARYAYRYLGCDDAREGRKRLFELFPYGYVGQACKIAGMRKPRAWSTG